MFARQCLVSVAGAMLAAAVTMGPLRAAGSDSLVDAVNRIVAIDGEAAELSTDRLTEVAEVACTTLGAVTGRTLTDVLQTAYSRLERDYDAAAATFAEQDAYRGFLAAERRLLAESGLSEPAVARAMNLIEGARAPGAQGLTASYSVKLHAGEINTVICEVYRRRTKGQASPQRDRRLAKSAANGLAGLAIIVIGNGEAAQQAEAPVAAASTAVGSIVVARAYSGLFR